MRKLILVLLIGALGVYLFMERKRNYPFDNIKTPSGRVFPMSRLPDECIGPACMHKVVYLTSSTDTAAIINEAQAVLPWLEAEVKNSAPKVAGVLAVQPGFLRLKAPKRVTALTFGALTPGQWILLKQEDQTSEWREAMGLKKD